jgi:hypothetical protein
VPPISFDNFAEEDDDSPNDVVNFAHANGEDEDDPMDGPVAIILGDFRTYVQNARNQFVPFQEPWLQSTLELLYILRKLNASLVLYDRVMAWHVRQLSTSQLCHDSILKREKVFSSLFKRYNMLDNLNIIRKVTLPSSHAQFFREGARVKNRVTPLIDNNNTIPYPLDEQQVYQQQQQQQQHKSIRRV